MLADSQKNRMTDFGKLRECLAENGVQLSAHEVEVFFDSVSQGQPTVNYLDVIASCRGQMSKQREAEVERLFSRLDTRRVQEIKTDALLKGFKAHHHPDVTGVGRPAAAVQASFNEALTLFGKLGGYDLQNGLIKFDEFLEFFDSLSSLEPRDDTFLAFIRDCFA